MKTSLVLVAPLLAAWLPLHAADSTPAPAPVEHPWVKLFNGKDLSGWTPKVSGHACGENPFNTFSVEDGILKVSYDGYGGKFKEQYGHLYSNLAYSHYILRMEYRFTGTKMPDAPDYCNFNSGVMIHAQPPQSMGLNQSFPSSMEFQFLADEGTGPRPTACVCTPGTNLELDGKLITRHITQSTSPTFAPEEWVKIEVEVHGSDEVIHRVNGKEVLRYQHPQLDPADKRFPSTPLIEAGAPLLLNFGHIALQAEGHPVWFRNIELKSLEPS